MPILPASQRKNVRFVSKNGDGDIGSHLTPAHLEKKRARLAEKQEKKRAEKGKGKGKSKKEGAAKAEEEEEPAQAEEEAQPAA